jgi:nucleoside-diphosphate-sugar epimerase
MKILITGTNGYIGKSLYNTLKNKYEVSTITRDKCDLTNSEDVNFYFLDTWFDVIIHCAVVGGSRLKEDDWGVMDSNLQMYYNILSNKSHYGKLIHLGSGAELYKKDQPYGFSKDTIYKSILTKNNFYNIRIFGVFDENELDTRFIKANIKRYVNKEPIIIYQDKLMDFIYMPDLIKIVEYYIKDNGPKEINCNYNKTFTLKEIANIINNLNDYKVEIKIEQENFGDDYIGNYLHLEIDFIGLKQGIIETYNKLK